MDNKPNGKYNTDWESNKNFKGWLSTSKKGPYFFHCIACQIDGTAGKSEIEKHANGKKHVKLLKSSKSQQNLPQLVANSIEAKLENTVKNSEMYLAAFIAEHNLPYTIMDHLPKLIQKVCPDSKIALKLKCGRTKTESIVTYVIGAVAQKNMIKLMKENKFSIIIILDESTDKSAIKHMSVIARIVNKNLIVLDEFVTLLEVQTATSEALYNLITHFFIKNQILYKENMIGYAADGANNMMGKHNSLATNLLKDVPHLFIFKCLCHSFHLCASYACLQLPRYVEDFARNVHNYIDNSLKRLLKFKEF